MKRVILLVISLIILSCVACSAAEDAPEIAASTLPVYEFTSRICAGTGLSVAQLITESVSCLHDYSLQVSQMRIIEGAEVVILSGGGLEDFMEDALRLAGRTIDASEGIPFLCSTHVHEEVGSEDAHEHHHANDPHIWLSPSNAKIMATNICAELSSIYPAHSNAFQKNLSALLADLTELNNYGANSLERLNSRELITFHDGFAYFADAFGLEILEVVEEESGSEAPASELIRLTEMVKAHNLPAIFTELNGSSAAASIISAECGVTVYALDMALSGSSYFDAMYYNFDTISEALK